VSFWQALVIATIPSVTAVPDGSSRVSRPRYASQVGDFQTVPGSLRNGARAGLWMNAIT